MTARSVAVVTGTRAEFGLLRPVMAAIEADDRLALQVLVTGTHLLPPARTIAEVECSFTVAARIAMQEPGVTGRHADAAALGRGVAGMAAWLAEARPQIVLVLGDRIEALAAALAAAVGGIRVAHVHGGDRAEGIADESMRHAISKMAHVHLPATEASAARLVRMGEQPERIHVVGSPAIDGLGDVEPIEDDRYRELGAPRLVLLMHPTGLEPAVERARAERLIAVTQAAGPTLVLHPNHDPGRDGIVDAVEATASRHVAHLPRTEFVGLLRRGAALVGNSSAGLIECAALGVPCVNVGTRQAGRERASNVIEVDDGDETGLAVAIAAVLATSHHPVAHPFGDGDAAGRIADVLATFDPALHALEKRNSY